ncbi:hypothetical protein [Ruminococcus sp.]|uniref:hypothetical protein n=1 Tax=Ruminococcus sp. TaxID=41978 RepID=UPI0025CBFBBD|nr:hypothetical protein [Ruminococcus sp.]
MVIRNYWIVKAFILFFICIVPLSSCYDKKNEHLLPNCINGNSLKVESNNGKKPFIYDESQAIVLDENDYANAQIVSQTDFITFYKQVIDIKEAYPNFNFMDIELPKGFTPVHFDENGMLYGNYVIDDNQKIASYNYGNNILSILVENEDESAISMVYIKDNYMIYIKDDNIKWQAPEYHLYDLNTNEDLIFYESAINPMTQSAYCMIHFNTPVIIDNKIYYDDIINIDEKNKKHRIIYCYDIKKRKLELMYDDAALPNEYMNKIAWFSLSNDETTGVFCNENGAMFKPKTLLGSYFYSYDNIISIHDNISENSFIQLIKGKKIDTDFDPLTGDPKDEATTSHGLKIVRNCEIEPILLTGNNVVAYATNIYTNGRYVTWYGSYIGSPMFYDVQKDIVVKIDFLDDIKDKNDIFYWFKVSNNKLFLSYGTYSDDSLRYMIISLK